MEHITLHEALALFAALRRDLYDESVLTSYIEELDGKLAVELLHVEPPRYRYPDSENVPLLVPKPYHNVYVLYLLAMTDLLDSDTERYALDASIYQTALQEWKAHYRRTHCPVKR